MNIDERFRAAVQEGISEQPLEDLVHDVQDFLDGFCLHYGIDQTDDHRRYVVAEIGNTVLRMLEDL